MHLERFESILYWPDDFPFFRMPQERFHGLKLTGRILALMAIAILVYGWVLWAGGLIWEDEARLKQMWSVVGLTRLWTADDSPYHPLSLTLLWVQHHFFGEKPLFYHVLSVVLHAINAALLWMILRRLSVPGAWLGAALFAAHPVQAQTIAWVSQQYHVIAATLYLWTVLGYLRLLKIAPPVPEELTRYGNFQIDDLLPSAPKRFYVASILACMLGILLDPVYLTLPITLALLTWWKCGPLTRADLRHLMPFFLIAVFGTAIIICKSTSIADKAGLAPPLAVWQRVLVAGHALWFYLLNIVRIYPRLFVYTRWSNMEINAAYTLAAIAGLYIAWIGRKRWGNLPIILSLMFTTLLLPALVSLLAQSAPAVYALDSDQYLASIIPLAAISAGFMKLAHRYRDRKDRNDDTERVARAGFAVTSVGLLVGLTVAQSLAYTSSETVWKTTLAHDPTNVVARSQYALLLSDKDPSAALKVLSEAGLGADDDLGLLDTKAKIYLSQSQYEQAIEQYLIAQRLAPDNRAILLGLAGAYESAAAARAAEGVRPEAVDDYKYALDALESALQHNPGDESIHTHISRIMLKQGRLAEAVQQCDLALQHNADYVPAKIAKAEALFRLGVQGDSEKYKSAFTELNDALRIDPRNFEACFVYASMLYQRHDLPHAEMYCRSALNLNPTSVEAWIDLGLIRTDEDHLKEAVWAFEEALKLQPTSQAAQRGKNLAEMKLASVK
jgi:tetratricopeptide (TPR) repeat protein